MQTEGEAAEAVYSLLDTAKRVSGPWAAVTVTHWLERNGAGCPDVPLLAEKVRDDAAIWAACAHQAEMEAYLTAALSGLERSVITDRAARRMAALGYRTMAPDDRLKFIEWVEKQ